MSIFTWLAHLPAAIADLVKSIFNHTKKEWENLSEADQQGLINGSKLADLLKQTIGEAEETVVRTVATSLGVSESVTTAAILAVGKDLGIDTGKISDVQNKLADKAQEAVTDNQWNSLWQLVAQSAAQWFTSGKFNWASLSMGLLEFIYNEFVKK